MQKRSQKRSQAILALNYICLLTILSFWCWEGGVIYIFSPLCVVKNEYCNIYQLDKVDFGLTTELTTLLKETK